jgi:DNA-binding NarL/FixJ family response regulator
LARKLKVDSAYNIRVDTEHDGPKWLSVTHVVVPSIKKDLGALIHIFHDVSREMKAIDLVTQLKGWVPPKSTNSAMTPATSAEQHEDLTQREQDVLRLLASGFNTAQVANKLVITPTTTRNHIQRILSKLGVHSRLEAVVTGARLGIL